jgi:polysaccharide export outer membrane protein
MTGCTIIPGSHFQGITSGDQTTNIEQELEKINIQIIDSSLINQQKKAQPKIKTPSSLTSIDTSNYEYKLGVGDVVTVGVWDHPELTIPAGTQRTAEFDGFKVQADGTVTYAYAANIPAAGRTISELRQDLVARLARVI